MALTADASHLREPRHRGLLSEDDVVRLYAERVAVNDDPAYLGRYDRFDFRSRFGAMVDRVEFPRLITLLEFERLVTKHAITAERVLMLNGGADGDPELAYLDHRHVDRADYDEDPARFDLHSPQFDRSDYDFAILSQTLEHLYDPGLAVAQLFAALAPGGYVWASVPTVSQLHSIPHHFITGLTPIGVACLFAHAGFEVVEVGQWGNNDFVSQTFALGIFPTFYDLTLRWRGVRHLAWTILTPAAWRRLAGRRFRLPVSDLVEDGLRNDFNRPAQTWALARKPADASALAGAEPA
jgi:SAM-dependent methyltransferase